MARGQAKDWAAEAKALPNDDFLSNVPLHVLLAEAVDVATFCKKYWVSQDGRPGLEQAGRGLPEEIGEEILSLQREAQLAQSEYVLTIPKSASGEAATRARFVLSEITATLEWLFDDGVEDENDERLAAVAQAHRDDPETNDALAGELEDYAALARRHEKQMKGLGGFDVALIDEAKQLAARLRQAPASPAVLSEEARRALGKRNRLLTLLSQRMARVRSAARFVFRNHAEVIREATSAYDRRRRAEARRRALKAGATTPATPAPSAPA
jgi:hypothetical protein